MKKYSVYTRVVFFGTVDVRANNEEEAQAIVAHNMGATLGEVSDGGCDKIVDWELDTHATDIEVEDAVEADDEEDEQ